MFSETTRDWIAFAGIVIGGVGLPLTLLGLYLTFRQSRDAKNAARDAKTAAAAARTAAEGARASLLGRMRLSTLNQALAAVNGVRTAIRKGEFEDASAQINALVAFLLELRETEGDLSTVLRRRYQSHLTALAGLDGEVEKQLDTSVDALWIGPSSQDVLRELNEFLVEIEVRSRTN